MAHSDSADPVRDPSTWMPGKEDDALALQILVMANVTDDAVLRHRIATLLHEVRTKRDRELRNHLKELGSRAESRKTTIQRLEKLFAREKKRHHEKIKDLDLLKEHLVQSGYRMLQISNMLRVNRGLEPRNERVAPGATGPAWVDHLGEVWVRLTKPQPTDADAEA